MNINPFTKARSSGRQQSTQRRSSDLATPRLSSSLEREDETASPSFDSFQSQDADEQVSQASGFSNRAQTRKKRTSWVYKHQAGATPGEKGVMEVFYDNKGAEAWPCLYCANEGKTKTYATSGGTKNIVDHLKKHNVFEDSIAQKRLLNQQQSIEEAMESAEHNPSKRRKIVEEEPEEKQLDGAVLESLFVRFLSANNQSLRLVECPEFRAFLTYVNSNVNAYLPNSHRTVSEWVLRQYNIERERITIRLGSARTKIHISIDVWTSPSTMPILAIVAHYISEDNELEHALLAMEELQGTHDGESVAPIVLKVLEEWAIFNKLGYIQSDNASNNDTLIRSLSKCKLYTVYLVYILICKSSTPRTIRFQVRFEASPTTLPRSYTQSCSTFLPICDR